MKRPKGFKETTKSGIEIEYLGDVEVDPAEQLKADAMAAQADKEDMECRVNFRWGKEQLQLIKDVADKIGIPYQTYIKSVLFRQATADAAGFAGTVVNSITAIQMKTAEQEGDGGVETHFLKSTREELERPPFGGMPDEARNRKPTKPSKKR
jgi:predicted DNA binding CopG/RHH family protein